MTSRDYFKGKRIAVIGLGPHGEMVSDIKFLIKAGALVGLYDLKSEARLKSHLVFLRSIGLANYVCGSIPADDMLDMDLIVLSHEYPRDSSFLKAAREKNIQIEYPETLFFKLAPPVTLVGVMGSCGKATVVSMLAPMLEEICSGEEGQGFFTIDPESAVGILAHLKKVKNGDLVLERITPDIMKELYAMRISPHVAIFTTVPGNGSYEKTPFEILAFQTYNNFLIATDDVIDATRNFNDLPRAKMLRTKPSIVPAEWDFKGRGPHDVLNAALVLQAARLFKVDDEVARHVLTRWKPLKGRLELVKKVKNVEFYNDTASVNSFSTRTAVESLSNDKNVVLVFGGATSPGDYRPLYSLLPEYIHTLVLLPGSGTMRERAALQKMDHTEVFSAPSVEEAARLALEHARKGDKVLFSPGFEVGGFDGSRRERGERFVKAVRSL